jgi:hypothetical protein
MAVVEHHWAAAPLRSKRMAPSTCRLRHVPRLPAVGHDHLHPEMQRLADCALAEQLAGFDQRRVENKVLKHL